MVIIQGFNLPHFITLNWYILDNVVSSMLGEVVVLLFQFFFWICLFVFWVLFKDYFLERFFFFLACMQCICSQF